MFCIESFPHDVQQRGSIPVEAGSASNADIKMADVTVQLCPETLLKQDPPSLGPYDEGVVCAVGRKNSNIRFESDKTVSRQHCTIRLIVSPNWTSLASSSTSSEALNKQWFAPRTKEENDACAEGVDLVVTDMRSKYGTFIMKQQKTPATMDKSEPDSNDTDTDTDNEAEAPTSICFIANKATHGVSGNEKSAEIEQINLVQHMKLTPNKPYPLGLSSKNHDAIAWIQCGVSGSLVRITHASTANGANAINPTNDRSHSQGSTDVAALSSNEDKGSCTRDEEEVTIMPLQSHEGSYANLEKENHGTIIETQQAFNPRPTKRSKVPFVESQWQSRITSHPIDRQIIRSDDSNQSYENYGTEKMRSPSSAVTDHDKSHPESRRKLPSPTKDGWLAIAPSKDRSAYRRIDITQWIEEGGMEEALTECRTDLIVVHEKNKEANNQRRTNHKKSLKICDFKKFHKNYVFKGSYDEKNITLTAVLPKETLRQNHKELTQQQIEENELFVDALFNPQRTKKYK